MRCCSLSVDLDEISCYQAIHGLTSGDPSHAVYDIALPRIREFASSLNLPLTLFVIGRDLARAVNVAPLRQLVSDGHEIGNHTQDHWYDLSRRSVSEQREQVAGASARIEAMLGVRASGFRAPGYTVSDELLAVVRDCGLKYDSSVFPCPPYYAAKAASLLGMKVRGQISRAILDTPRVLRAPLLPYRIGVPYWVPGAGLTELPIQVAGPLRLPFIGTALTLLGPTAARLMARGLVGTPFINLELHGIDFLEARDVPKALLEAQPDLRVSWSRKLETLSAVVGLFRGEGYSAVRLDEAARVFS